MYKLSICIPTYNRAQYLTECIESVLTSIIGYESQVEIIISDNASTDNTEKVVKTNYSEYLFIKYYKNSANIGSEANFFLAAERSSGEYCLLLGDDDKITPDAIKQIIDMLNLYPNISIVVLNFAVYSKNFDVQLVPSYHRIHINKYYEDQNSLMLDFGPTLSFISSVVFEREAINKINIENYNYFKEFGFSFLYMIYDYVSQKPSSFYISDSLILQRGDNSAVNIKKCFFEGLPKVFITLSEYGYSSNAIKSSKEKIFKNYLRGHLLKMKINQSIIDDDMKKITFSLLNSKVDTVVVNLIFISPWYILNVIKILKVFLKGIMK